MFRLTHVAAGFFFILGLKLTVGKLQFCQVRLPGFSHATSFMVEHSHYFPLLL